MQGLAVFSVLQGLEELSDDGLQFHTFLAFLVSLTAFYFLFRHITGRSAQIALRGIMDAFFIGPLNCFDLGGEGMAPLLQKLNQWKIPTFARDGSEYVKAGALMPRSWVTRHSA